MPRTNDKRADFRHAYEVAAREAREAGQLDEAHILERRANELGAHMTLYPNLASQPPR